MSFVVLPEQALRGGLEQAGLPGDVVNAVFSIQQSFAARGFDIATGDIEAPSGAAAKSLEEALAAAFS